jgi:alpha-tubulin suppressor-like RCC1 family protein
MVFLKSDGTVWTIGQNGRGQLGNGTTMNSFTPVQVSGLSGVIAIASGAFHTIALKPDGTVYTWGENTNGQLGDGTTSNRSTPEQVRNITGGTIVGAGAYHTIALTNP